MENVKNGMWPVPISRAGRSITSKAHLWIRIAFTLRKPVVGSGRSFNVQMMAVRVGSNPELPPANLQQRPRVCPKAKAISLFMTLRQKPENHSRHISFMTVRQSHGYSKESGISNLR